MDLQTIVKQWQSKGGVLPPGAKYIRVPLLKCPVAEQGGIAAQGQIYKGAPIGLVEICLGAKLLPPRPPPPPCKGAATVVM